MTLIAGNDAHVAGSDVIAKQDISLVGGSVTIDPGNDTLTRHQSYEQKRSGLTLQISSPITDALLTLGSQAKEATEAGNDRLKALDAVKMLETGWALGKGATQSATALAKGDLRNAGITISLSVGASKSQSSSDYSSNTVSGSSLSGGGNVNVIATGANGSSGDISMAGSGITGQNVTLAAAHDLNLVAASNNTDQKSSNSSSGWSVGGHISYGKQTGIGVQASGYVASGSDNGNSTEYVNSRVNASDTLTLSSGNDTLLSGAQALGNRIVSDAGNNLTITSLQDIDNYQSKQQSASGGFSFTWGTPSGSVGVSASTSKINSEYVSVGDQSGLFAGNGGFDIFAGNHTQLNGAVIASTADAANNSFSTGTLGWDSIGNHAEYHASSASVGFSGSFDSSQKPGEQYSASGLPAMVNMSGSASGTTRSAVADGTITVRDTQNQTQDVAGLSRDTDSANGHIDKIFDKEKVENQMAFAQGVQELAGKVAGDVSAYKLDAAEKEVSDRLLKENPNYATLSQEALHDKVLADPAYKAVAADWGTGGTYSMVTSAVAGALGGLSAGNLGAAASGAMAPYIANEIKKQTTTYDAEGNPHTNLITNTMAHAVAGAVLAQLAGNDAAAGAAGAAGGELMAHAIIATMYPGVTDPNKLTESQKQTVSALSQIAAGFAGGLASGSAQGVGTGAVAGKNAVENNSLSGDKARETVKQAVESLKDQVRNKLGNGTTSSIANGIINALADTGDAALGGADYAADAAMALAACAAGDSYCSTALNDLAGKNQAVADRVKALMKSETWSAVASTVKEAGEGNQAALEATGGMLAGIILPGKKIPDVGAVIVSDSVAFSTKQLDKKFKHASDFGVVTTKKNADTITEYQTAIKSHLDNTSTYEHGTYLLVPESKVYFNPQTNNVVVVDKADNFVSGWKLDPQTKQYENYMNNGTLR